MKKILSVVIAISMLLGMMIPMGITVSAAEVTECATWDAVVAAVEGDSAASIKLTADVSATSSIASFAGTFDGNGKTVTITDTLFDAVADGATIKNLTVAGETTSAPFIAVANGTISFTDVTTNVTANVAESADMAAFIAKVNGEANITFTNCVNKGAVSANKSVGAFIGYCGSPLTATFTNCVNEGTIKSSAAAAHAGGFIGCLEASAKFDVTFDKCASSGSVIGDNTGKLETAGFVAFFSGTSESSLTFTNCLSNGSLDDKSENDSDKYSASGYVSRAKSGTISFTNCLSNLSSVSSGTNRTANYWYYNEGATLNVTNSYYIEGVAASAAETGKDFTAVTAEQLASGEIAYKLGEAWGQDLSTENVPSIGGETVYQYSNGTTYSNTPEGQGGDDTPDLSERFSFTYETTSGKAVIDGPKYMTVGSSDAITVTFTSEVGLLGFSVGLITSDNTIVSFPGEVTFTLDVDTPWTDSTNVNHTTNSLAGFTSDVVAFYEAVVTIPVSALAEGAANIDFLEHHELNHTDVEFNSPFCEEALNYTITVVAAEGGEGGNEGDEPTSVDLINVNGYVEPTVGANIIDPMTFLSVPADAPYSIVEAYWYNDSPLDAIPTEETFLAGYSYSLGVMIRLADGYVFADEYTVQLNGDASLVDVENTYEDNATDLMIWSVITELPAEGGEGGNEGDEPTVIDIIGINGFAEPTEGASVAENIAALQAAGEGYTISAAWYTFGDEPAGDTFGAGSYFLRVAITANEGYVIADNATFTINDGDKDDVIDTSSSTVYEGGASALLDTVYITAGTAGGGEGGGESTDNVVTNVNVEGYVEPTVGASLADALANLSVPEGAPYSIVEAYWFNDATLEIATEETFAAGGMYCLYVRFALADGYTLDAENCTYALNGDATLVLFGSPNYDETVDCDFLICSITTTLEGDDTTPDGSEENPFVITNKDDVDAIDVPAGETYYFIIDLWNVPETVGEDFIGNLLKVIGEGATINGGATLDLPTNGRMGWPVLFSITAGANENAGAEIVVPKGTFNNPDTFDENGEAEIALTSPKNDFEPYIFLFTADKSGLLTVTAPEGAVVTINNLTTYQYGDSGVNTAFVKAGDEIQVIVATDGADVKGKVSISIDPIIIDAVDVSGITAPENGQTVADYAASFVPELPADAKYNVTGIYWFELDPETMASIADDLPDDYVFDSAKTYGFQLNVEADDGYEFAVDAVITANGGTTELYDSVTDGDFAALAIVFNPAPSTGDNSAIAIFAIAAVATIGCVALALRKKKED